MTLQELYTKLKAGMDIPIAYQDFSAMQAPPYAAFFETDASAITADGIVIAEAQTVEIHLITKSRDLALESTLESILASCVLAWDRSTDYDGKQKVYDTVYELTLVNGKD